MKPIGHPEGNLAKLCWSCYLKQSGKSPLDDGWDLIPCDDRVQEVCAKCGLNGIYVREVTPT